MNHCHCVERESMTLSEACSPVSRKKGCIERASWRVSARFVWRLCEYLQRLWIHVNNRAAKRRRSILMWVRLGPVLRPLQSQREWTRGLVVMYTKHNAVVVTLDVWLSLQNNFHRTRNKMQTKHCGRNRWSSRKLMMCREYENAYFQRQPSHCCSSQCKHKISLGTLKGSRPGEVKKFVVQSTSKTEPSLTVMAGGRCGTIRYIAPS